MTAMVFDAPETQEIETARPYGEGNAAGVAGQEGHRSQDIIGKTVISVSTGQKLGTVDDLLVDPAAMRVAALLLSKGGLINRDVVAIPVEDVEAWGQNAIMVNGPESALRREDLVDHEKWVSATDHIRGHPIITVDGTRIGQVDDLLVDQDGYVTLYEIGEGGMALASRDKEKKTFPANATRTIGQDVIIVDSGGSG